MVVRAYCYIAFPDIPGKQLFFYQNPDRYLKTYQGRIYFFNDVFLHHLLHGKELAVEHVAVEEGLNAFAVAEAHVAVVNAVAAEQNAAAVAAQAEVVNVVAVEQCVAGFHAVVVEWNVAGQNPHEKHAYRLRVFLTGSQHGLNYLSFGRERNSWLP